MKNQVPDKVPCAPDISNMIPCRLKSQPFWEILYYQNPPLWQVYVDACRQLGLDAFFFHATLGTNPLSQFEHSSEIIKKEVERLTVRNLYKTPAGNFEEDWAFPIADSESCIKKAFDTIKEGLPKLKYILSDAIEVRPSANDHIKSYLKGEFALGGYCNTPMLPYHWLHGQLEAAVVEYYTDLEVMHEYRELFHKYNLRKAELFLDQGIDFLLIESSGSLTMQSPEIFADMQLETIKAITKIYKEAGVPTMFHSCGVTMELLPLVADTDLDGIQPLEPPPTGDVNLAEVKKLYGEKLALMGNLNTPELMLRGSEQEVYQAACEAIEVAKAGGGFILSTGDQCGRDTPNENLLAMLRAREDVGYY